MPISESDLAALLSSNPALRISPDSLPASRPTVKVAEQPPMKPETAKVLAEAMLEDELQTSVIKLAHLFGYRVAHFRSVKVTRKDGSTYWQTPVQADGEGWPDLILARADPAGGLGRVIFAELKSERGKVEPAQTAWLSLLKLAQRVEVYLWRPIDLLSGDIEKLLR